MKKQKKYAELPENEKIIGGTIDKTHEKDKIKKVKKILEKD